ncbi:MAG: LamG domain-containing protein, partial [Nanoarchaeota archaeon]
MRSTIALNNFYISSGNVNIDDNQFHQLAVSSIDTQSPQFYFDGQSITTSTDKWGNNPSASSWDILIGAAIISPCDSTVPSQNYVNGIIDEVAIYNRALSAEEIKNIYDGNLIAKNKGCISDSAPTQDKPLQIISQVSKNIANGETANSQILVKALNQPVDTVCQICATPHGGGGCVDVRMTIK